MEEFFIFEDRVFKLGRKIWPIFKLKYSKFEQNLFNIKDFMAQNIISCLSEGYSSWVSDFFTRIRTEEGKTSFT